MTIALLLLLLFARANDHLVLHNVPAQSVASAGSATLLVTNGYLVCSVESDYKGQFSKDGALVLSTATGQTRLPLQRMRTRFFSDEQGQHLAADLFYPLERAQPALLFGVRQISVSTDIETLVFRVDDPKMALVLALKNVQASQNDR